MCLTINMQELNQKIISEFALQFMVQFSTFQGDNTIYIFFPYFIIWFSFPAANEVWCSHNINSNKVLINTTLYFLNNFSKMFIMPRIMLDKDGFPSFLFSFFFS